MLWSNATPIRRLGDVGYKCCYCETQYLNPANLKIHTLENHTDVHKAFFMKYNMDRYVVRLDITLLKCKICDKNFDALDQLMEHLKIEHRKKIYSDIKSHIIPFKFETDTPQCCICMTAFTKYKILVEHMNLHLRNYICEVCDLGFVNSISLANHKLTHKDKSSIITNSEVTLVSIRGEIHKHRSNIHEIMLWSNATPIRRYGDVGYMCAYCEEQYVDPAALKEHTLDTHKNIQEAYFMNYKLTRFIVQLDITSLQCNICNQHFNAIEEIMDHLRVDHQKQIYTDIKNHIIPFKFETNTLQCCVCTTTLSKFSMLVEHMNIHYKNYICDLCNEGFINSIRFTNHKLTHKTKASDSTSKEIIFVSMKGELHKHRSNIKEVLLCSNATPIRRFGDLGYQCCYCEQQYLEPARLKKHTLETHKEVQRAFFMKLNMTGFIVRLDITALRCNICEQSIDTVEELMDHLNKVHKKTIYTDIKSHITPLKFDTEILHCCICMKTFSKFKVLLEHMNIHYRNYICQICDIGFTYSNSLRTHIYTIHNNGDKGLKKKAVKNTNTLTKYLNKCGYCNETFNDYRKKEAHLVSAHGLKIPTPKCQACDKVFKNRRLLNIHIRKDHLMEREFKCSECDMSFFRSTVLKKHMVKHTGLRSLKCSVCSKIFGRPKSLKEHMKVHDDYRRFKCEHCEQAFVQKCSWKGHMKSKHGEIV